MSVDLSLDILCLFVAFFCLFMDVLCFFLVGFTSLTYRTCLFIAIVIYMNIFKHVLLSTSDQDVFACG